MRWYKSLEQCMTHNWNSINGSCLFVAVIIIVVVVEVFEKNCNLGLILSAQNLVCKYFLSRVNK